MKASEYLWKYIDLQNHLEGESPEQAQGELRLAMTQAGIRRSSPTPPGRP